MSAAADANLAAREIRSAPPLRLPSRPAAGGRRRHLPGHWISRAVPLAAVAAVVALAVSLVLVKGARNEGAVPLQSTASASPAVSAGPGGVPRYYVAWTGGRLVAGDSVTGTILANLAIPVRKGYTNELTGITAADDDRTFAVSVLTYPTASVHGSDSFAKVTETASWYVVRLAPGTATPARLTLLPVKPQALHGDAGLITANADISRSGSALAVTTLTASGGLAVQVFSVATGQLLHDWTSNVSPDVQPGLTWIDRDRDLAVETPILDAAGMTETVRELSVSGPASGDLLADGKVVAWNVQLGPNTQSLLETCTASPGLLSRHSHLISADGTAFGCAAMTGPDTDPTLSFLTYPLPPGTAVTAKARVDYQVTIGAKKQVAYAQILWISPSGGTVVGQWATLAKGAERVAPNGLHFGAMSHGKFTPLRFPPGFSSPTIAF
jgi:hypothetical protein